MTDKELRRLSRADLVDVIYELEKENEESREQIRKLQKALDDKILILSFAGSIAEASLKLNGVFEAAQAAADQYVASVKAACERAERTQSDTRSAIAGAVPEKDAEKRTDGQ